MGFLTGVVLGGLIGVALPTREDLGRKENALIYGGFLGLLGLGGDVTIGFNNLIQQKGKKKNKPRYRIMNY